MMFEGTCWEGWDVASTVILDGGVIDGVVSVGVDESMSYILMYGWGGGRLGLAVWDEPCLAFLPRQLGRFPISRFLGKGFLLSPVDRRTWDWVSGRLSSPITSFSLFSFIVDIPKAKKKKKHTHNKQQINKYDRMSKWPLNENLLLRTVTSWAMALSEGSGPSPHLARRRRVTKEWKSLSTWRRALWMRSRWNLLKDGRLTPVKQMISKS